MAGVVTRVRPLRVFRVGMAGVTLEARDERPAGRGSPVANVGSGALCQPGPDLSVHR